MALANPPPQPPDPTERPSRLPRAAGRFIEACWLATILLTPLAANPWGFQYDLLRVALMRGLALLMLAAHLAALAWAPAPPDPRRWLRRPLVRPILLVGGMLLLSTLVSISPLVSLWGTYQRQQGIYLSLCLILWALLAAAHLRAPAQRRRLAGAVAAAGALTALTPFIQSLARGASPFSWRPGGSLGNPIFLGGYLIMTAPFTLAMIVEAKHLGGSESPHLKPADEKGTAKRIYPVRCLALTGGCVALLVQLGALILTQARGPWIGAAAGLALLTALMLWKTRRRLVFAGLAAALLAAGALVAGLNVGLAPSSPLSQLPYVQRLVLTRDLQGGTARVRLVLWRAAARVIAAWPEVGLEADRLRFLRPLAGYGPDTALFVYTAVYPPELAHIEDPAALWDRAHNETLDLIVMQGWLGLAAWAALGAACIRRGLALWRAAADPAERAWAAAPLAALTAHAVEVQFAFSTPATMLMSWLCVAWLAAPLPGPAPRPSPPAPDQRSRGEIRRWRVYAVLSALLLTVAAARLEGGALGADRLVERARALDRAGRWGESIPLYDRALGLIPWQAAYLQFRAEAFYNLARAMSAEETDVTAQLLAAADRSLARARRLTPLDLELYSNAGVVHAHWSEAIAPGHLATAVAFYQQAFRLAPTRAALRADLGHIYHNHGLYEEALAQYQATLEIDPRFAPAYYDSGLAWQALGRLDRARQAFETALALAPECQVCREALE